MLVFIRVLKEIAVERGFSFTLHPLDTGTLTPSSRRYRSRHYRNPLCRRRHLPLRLTSTATDRSGGSESGYSECILLMPTSYASSPLARRHAQCPARTTIRAQGRS